MPKKIQTVVIAIFVCIFIVAAGVFAYDRLLERNFTPPPEAIREEIPHTTMPLQEDGQPIQDVFAQYEYNDAEPDEPPPSLPRELLPRIIELREQYNNPDIVGYLQIPGTNISYPVAQTGNNAFYLYHNLHMQPDNAGAIFLDYENNLANLMDDNTIIYGHNMRGGHKFHNLRHFFGEAYFRERPYLLLTTPYEETIWDVFSFFQTNIIFHPVFDYLTTNFPCRHMFYEFISYLQYRSVHTTDIVLTPDCQILILSTCASLNPTGDERYILISRLRI